MIWKCRPICTTSSDFPPLVLQMMLKIKTTSDDCCNSCGGMAVVSGLSVAKKYRRAYLRKIRRKEYRKLKAVVPAVAHQEKVSKVRCW